MWSGAAAWSAASRWTTSLAVRSIRMRPTTAATPVTCSRWSPSRRYCTEGGKEKVDRPDGLFHRKPDTRDKKPPISWKTFGVTFCIMATMYGWFRYTKEKKDRRLEKERKKEIGKTMIGGAFELVDQTGKTVKSDDLKGKWILLYFGFTHCPDICPDEMEKMAEVTDKLEAERKRRGIEEEVLPVFITVDPARDGVKEVGEYVKEFHPRMLGLTGTVEQVTKACKAFRVYFSAGPADQDDDYIVDHTIIIYLIDPEGEFLDYYGIDKNAEQVTQSCLAQMSKYVKSSPLSILNSLKL